MHFKRFLEKMVENCLIYGKDDSVESVLSTVFETIMKMERSEFLQENGEGNKGNSYYERMARGITNFFKLKVPRGRLGLFHPVFLDSLKQEQAQLEHLAFSLYVKGLSTRDITDVIDENFGRRYSPSFVSKITKEFEEIRESWLNRKLDKEYFFVFVDAIYLPVRRDTVESEAFYIIMGLNKEFKREILGIYNFPSESTAGWESAFEDLKERGFEKCLMFIADGFKGIKKAVKNQFPQHKLQLCLVHKLSNLKKRIRSSAFQELREDFNAVFKKGDVTYTVEDGKKALQHFIDKWKKHYTLLPFFTSSWSQISTTFQLKWSAFHTTFRVN
ncbi:MAG: IS256 family transposase [bacterium]